MGDMMREYWLPCLYSWELTADGDPQRVRMLGEDLIAWRDSNGATRPTCARPRPWRERRPSPGTRTVPLFAPDSARPADNHSVITEFLVDDVDRVHQNLTGFVTDFVNGPTTMPWGNRSLLFRDPDGNLVNFFTPVTPAAIEKFAR